MVFAFSTSSILSLKLTAKNDRKHAGLRKQTMSDELYTEASMATELILFYDGGCPLCVHEMRQLKALDQKRKQRLQFEDIWAHDFAKRFPAIDIEQANRILHGQRADGTLLYGLDVTHAAWSAVGRGWLTAPLRWPGLRWLADKGYLGFAKHRNRISKLITGKERCLQCSLDE